MFEGEAASRLVPALFLQGRQRPDPLPRGVVKKGPGWRYELSFRAVVKKEFIAYKPDWLCVNECVPILKFRNVFYIYGLSVYRVHRSLMWTKKPRGSAMHSFISSSFFPPPNRPALPSPARGQRDGARGRGVAPAGRGAALAAGAPGTRGPTGGHPPAHRSLSSP